MSTYDVLLLASYPILPIELSHLVLIDGLYSLIPFVGPCTIFPNSIRSYFTPMSSRLKAPNMGSLEFTYALNTTKNHSTPPIMFLKTFKQVTNWKSASFVKPNIEFNQPNKRQ